jgi:predicted neuraminidase
MKRLSVLLPAAWLVLQCYGIAAEDDPAAQPPKLNWHPGPEYADNVRMFQGIPSIERAHNGRLWATWYGGGVGEGAENYVMLVTSGDDGRTWSEPRLIIDPDGKGPIRASEPGLWHDPQGRLWLMWGQYSQGLRGPANLWTIVTEDSGQEAPHWSAPRRLADGENFNKPVVLSQGTWLWPRGEWDLRRISRPLLSSDEGRTFVLGGEIRVPEKDRAFEEYLVVERRDGSLWLLTRTKYGIGESVSTDGARTWSEVRPSAIPHPSSRFFLSRLKSGKLLLVKHGAIEQKTKDRSLLTALLSEDDGKTWSGGLLLDERSKVSYPDGVQAPDGRIYIIYDYDRDGEKQVLMAVFTEEDVLTREFGSSGARKRVLVNQATGKAPPRQ